MRRFVVAVLFLPLLLCGCFRPSPGGLQGVWSFQETFDGTDFRRVRTIEYTFNGDTVARTVTHAIRSTTSGESTSLVQTDTGTFTVDTSVSPARIDTTGITQTAYPTNTQFLVFAAIAGSTERAVVLGFSENAALTLRAKGLFERSGNTLQVKFGNDVDYPLNLDPPDVFALDKEFRLFAN
jgi:hypothetical protein